MLLIFSIYLRVKVSSEVQFNYIEPNFSSSFYRPEKITDNMSQNYDVEVFISPSPKINTKCYKSQKLGEIKIGTYSYINNESLPNSYFINTSSHIHKFLIKYLSLSESKIVTNKNDAKYVISDKKNRICDHFFLNITTPIYIHYSLLAQKYIKNSTKLRSYRVHFYKFTALILILNTALHAATYTLKRINKQCKISHKKVLSSIVQNQNLNENCVDLKEEISLQYFNDFYIDLSIKRNIQDSFQQEKLNKELKLPKISNKSNSIQFTINNIESKIFYNCSNDLIKNYFSTEVATTISNLMLSERFLEENLHSLKSFIEALCMSLHFRSVQLFIVKKDKDCDQYEEIHSFSSLKDFNYYLDLNKIMEIKRQDKTEIYSEGNNTYIISSQSIENNEFILIFNAQNTQSVTYYDIGTKIALFFIPIWANRICESNTSRILDSFEKYLIEMHDMFLIEYYAQNMKPMLSIGNVDNRLINDVNFNESCAMLSREKIPIMKQIFKIGSEEPIWYSVSGKISYDETQDKNVLVIIAENVSKHFIKQEELKREIKSIRKNAKMIGIHFLNVKTFELINTQLSKNMGFEPTTNLLSFIPEEAIDQIKKLKTGDKDTIDLYMKDRTKGRQYYTIIKTTESSAFMFSVSDTIEMASILKNASNFISISQNNKNFFAFFSLRFSSSNDYPSFVKEIKYDELLDLVDPNDWNKINGTDLMNLREPKTLEISMRLLDSMPFEPFQMALQPHEGEIVILVFNITSIKQTNQKLQEAEELLQLAFTNSNVHLWHYSSEESKIFTVEPETEEPIELGPKSIEHNVPLEYQKDFIDALEKAKREKKKIDVEVPFFFDKLHWMLVRGTTFEDELVGIYIDLTDLRETYLRLEQQKTIAEEAAQAKSNFLANLTHEVRNPTFEIVKILELLANTELEEDERELVSIMQTSIFDLLELLDDTLDLSKIEQGLTTPKYITFNVFEQMFDIEKRAYENAERKGIKFYMNTDPNHPVKYIGNPRYLTRILSAMLSNAVKFTEKGYYRLTSYPRDNGFQLIVSDTGIGMSPEMVARIRQQFKSGPLISVRETGGAGVGFSVIIAMLRKIGGELEIVSELGVGTTVKAWLPFEPAFVMIPPRIYHNKTALFFNQSGTV